MKRSIKLLLIVSLVFMLCSCKKKEEVPKEPPLAEDEVILEGIKYKLDLDDGEYGIKYKIANNFRKSTMINAINYFSEKINDESYFVIRLLKYKNKDVKYAIKDSTDNTYDKEWDTKINDLDYKVVRFKNPIGNEVYTNIYYHRHKKTTYAFVFTAAIDLTELEEKFLSRVEY